MSEGDGVRRDGIEMRGPWRRIVGSPREESDGGDWSIACIHEFWRGNGGECRAKRRRRRHLILKEEQLRSVTCVRPPHSWSQQATRVDQSMVVRGSSWILSVSVLTTNVQMILMPQDLDSDLSLRMSNGPARAPNQQPTALSTVARSAHPHFSTTRDGPTYPQRLTHQARPAQRLVLCWILSLISDFLLLLHCNL